MRVKKGDETELRDWAGRCALPIELLRVVHKSNSFELEVVPA
jgi:hypothetical protein